MNGNRLLDSEHSSAVFEIGNIKEVDGKEVFTGPVRQEKKLLSYLVALLVVNPQCLPIVCLMRMERVSLIEISLSLGCLITIMVMGLFFVQHASTQAYSKALKMAIKRGDNIILPRVGGNSVVDEAIMLKEGGYNVASL